MRIFLSVFLVISVILCSFTGRAEAELGDEDFRWGCTPVHKLERGLVNICTFPLELPASMISVADEKGEIFGFIIGAGEGILASVCRALSGVYDTVTFLLPSYTRPIMEPEYAIQSLNNALED